MKKKLATFLISLGLLTGFAVVSAPAAQAVNYYNCYWKKGPYVKGLGTYWDKYCWADYSWWEEVSYPWPSDGWERRGSEIR